MRQVAFDAEVLREREIIVGRGRLLKRAPELVVHGLVAQVGDVRKHARRRQSALRLLLVVAVEPVLVVHDRLAADPVERDALRGHARRGGDGDHAVHRLRVGDAPLERQHAAHGAARHAEPFFDPEVIHQALLRAHHVRDREDREIHVVAASGVRVDAAGAGRTGTPADDVGADDEKLVGVERLAGSDHVVPPAGLFVLGGMVARQVRIAGKGVFDQDGVIRLGGEFAVGLVADHDAFQAASAVEGEFFLEKIVGGLYDPD